MVLLTTLWFQALDQERNVERVRSLGDFQYCSVDEFHCAVHKLLSADTSTCEAMIDNPSRVHIFNGTLQRVKKPWPAYVLPLDFKAIFLCEAPTGRSLTSLDAYCVQERMTPCVWHNSGGMPDPTGLKRKVLKPIDPASLPIPDRHLTCHVYTLNRPSESQCPVRFFLHVREAASEGKRRLSSITEASSQRARIHTHEVNVPGPTNQSVNHLLVQGNCAEDVTVDDFDFTNLIDHMAPIE